MSVLREWFADARAEGLSEAQAVRVVARRLGENETTARRVLLRAGEKLGGGDRGSQSARLSRRPAAPRKPLDEGAVRAAYRVHRKGGLGSTQAVKATARQVGVRPHDVRRVVGVTEFALRNEDSDLLVVHNINGKD